VRLRGFAFRSVDRRKRGCVDDHVRAKFPYAGHQLVGIAEIALPAVQRREFADERRQARKFPADLAVASEEQQPQG